MSTLTDTSPSNAADRLILLPAVDVQAGQAVQLIQGVSGSERIFGDPREAALRWQSEHAEWLHLVDLDAAFGRGDNAAVIADVVAAMEINVELSGGIRDDASLERALATGARRVNVGTAALENPEWCERIIGEYGDRVAIGLDVRGQKLAARGWTRTGGDVFEQHRMTEAGCVRFVVTDVRATACSPAPTWAAGGGLRAHQGESGGKWRHLIAARHRMLSGLVPIGVEGAIVGTALYPRGHPGRGAAHCA